MCGICGWIEHSSRSRVDRATLERMNSALAHRGPNDSGSIFFDNAALGMRRLSIIDLSTGHQPIANEDGTCWIVFNGEIYNFRELHGELESRGHLFRTRSDTEVILHAYEEWGPDCVVRLRGMFAFCIVELSRDSQGDSSGTAQVRRAFFARDRAGKKPLYYFRNADSFVFGSEIKSILAHPDVPRRVNRPQVPLYLAYGYVPAPHTIFEGVYELPPGHTLTVQEGQVSVHSYWDLNYGMQREPRLSEQETIERLRAQLEEAVRVRLTSDVPLGAFLSGGIDSTAVVAFMARLMDRPVKTFAIGFEDDPSFNELEYARLAARTYGTDHHEFLVRPNAIDLLPKLVWHYDQPFSDSSAIPTYLVSQLTREHVTVALSGDGGDELFAGYERFAAARLAESYNHTPKFLQAALAHLLRALPESTSYYGFVRRARRFVESAPRPLAERYLGWAAIFQDQWIRELLADSAEVDPMAHLQPFFERVRGVDPIGQLLYVHAKTCLPSDLLVKTDRMSMANSLEARCPLLDQELIEFSARIPSDLKLKGLSAKYILKKALDGIVPREILHRKKHGFSVPVGRWFRTDLKQYVREILLSSRSLKRGYFNEEVLRQIIDEHQSGKRDHANRIWTLLTFEMWHQVFLDRPEHDIPGSETLDANIQLLNV